MQCMLFLVLLAPFFLNAATGPYSPTRALNSFQTKKGNRVELVAAEPLVCDPVAMCFDKKGHIYVVEGRSYPHLGKTPPPKLGTVVLLEDENGDGFFEKRTTFAEGFTFPNGVMPWKGGVFVTCAPDIWFLKDTTGDGRADVRRVVLTGFGTKSSSEQLRVASPTLGPDGWVYITSGLTDASVTSPLHPKRAAVKAKRQDGRFHPETFVYEPLAGTGQFGQCFDAAGNRFVSSNRNPLMHVVIAPGLLRRNQHYSFSEVVENVVPVAAKVHPLSPDTTAASYIPSLLSRQHAGTYTSASGICIRGRSVFICEPAQNLVQRQVLTPAGATFTAAHPTPGHDFLASSDQWFRPVHTTVGPDGALYICDMVRQFIDHPRYLPEDIRGKLDFKAGTDQGRIWRVILRTPEPPKPTTAQKHAALLNLQIREGKFPKTPVEELQKKAESKNPAIRFHSALLLGALDAPNKHRHLAQILSKDSSDKWTRAAVLAASEKQALNLLHELQKYAPAHSLHVLEELGSLLVKSSSLGDIRTVLKEQLRKKTVWGDHGRIVLLAGIADGTKTPFAQLCKKNSEAHQNVEAVLETARMIAGKPAEQLASRLDSIKLLGNTSFDRDGNRLISLLDSVQPYEIQIAAIAALGRYGSPDVSKALMHPPRWSGHMPDLREKTLGVLLSRTSFHPALMDALEKGIVPVHALSPARRRVLERNKVVGPRAKKLFTQHVGGDRMKAYEAAKPVLALKADATRGTAVFIKACALCHTHGGQGHAVGPDLTGLRNQPAESLLLHIIVPNHEVYGSYTMYEVDTKDDQTFAGLLAAETPRQITLKLPLGLTKTIPRKIIKILRASPKSLMPDQLEKAMTKQELADLIAFLKK